MAKSTFIMLFLLGNLTIHEALACSCIGERTVKEEIKHSALVFVGTPVNKEVVTFWDSTLASLGPGWELLGKATVTRFDFEVESVYKGKITQKRISVYTGNGGGDCGIQFELGVKYIIYGEKDTYLGHLNNAFNYPSGTNIFWTHRCLRTTAFHQAEIKEIEKNVKKKRRKIKN